MNLSEIFDYDAGTGALHRDGMIAGGLDSRGYVQVYVDRRPYRAHRLIWMMHYGVWPVGIDHINGIKWDNRLENLRVADASINGRNVPPRNGKGISGVTYRKDRKQWVAQIAGDARRTLYNGKDFFEACCRRKAAELKHNYTGRNV